jgi:hypothetical protein
MSCTGNGAKGCPTRLRIVYSLPPSASQSNSPAPCLCRNGRSPFGSTSSARCCHAGFPRKRFRQDMFACPPSLRTISRKRQRISWTRAALSTGASYNDSARALCLGGIGSGRIPLGSAGATGCPVTSVPTSRSRSGISVFQLFPCSTSLLSGWLATSRMKSLVKTALQTCWIPSSRDCAQTDAPQAALSPYSNECGIWRWTRT